MGEAPILISLDMDWAPDELIEDSLALLDDHGVRATLFMTHRPGVDVSNHELALHPDFKDLDLHRPIASLLDVFPDARGARSHSLFFSYRLIDVYERLGIKYQSNVLAYKQGGLAAFQLSRKVAEVPIFFMDNIHLQMEPATAFQYPDLSLGEGALQVFDFHPIHIYLNTETLERYNAAKPNYHDAARLAEFRNTRRPGIRDMFITLLKSVSRNNSQSHAIGDWFRKEFRWTY